MPQDLASIVAKLREAQQKGSLGSLVGHEEAGKHSGEIAGDYETLVRQFGQSDIDALDTPASTGVPGPGAPGTTVPGPGAPPPSAPAPGTGTGTSPALQGLGAAMGGGSADPGAGWAAGQERGTPNTLGRRTPVQSAMNGLRAAGRLY